MALSFVACNKGDRYTHDSAREAAERYYAMLLADNYGGAVDITWMDNPMAQDSIPSDLRQSYIDLLRQFKAEMPRGGMLSATALRDTLYGDSLAYVFLDLCLADSTHEEVLQPLVFSRGKWWIK